MSISHGLDRSYNPEAIPVRAYARMAGVLLLLTAIAGGFGEFYVPSTIVVPGDAAATAANITGHNLFFRLGFAAYLVEALCDIGLTWIMYVLLRPTRGDLALLMVFFSLVATAVFAGSELFFFAATFILDGSTLPGSFSIDQVNALASLSLEFYGYGVGIFMVFYGTAAVIRGYLIFHSGYLPKALGVLLGVAGLGFIVRNFLLVLVPAYAWDVLLLPMFVAAPSMMVWFLVKGVDVHKWEARASRPTG